MNYVVDTSFVNKIVDGLASLDQLPQDGKLLASHIQIDEINKTRSEERRARLFLQFAKMNIQIVPTESFVIGTSRLGGARLSDGDLFTTILGELDRVNGSKSNNSMDALIAEAAIKNDYALLTADYHLAKIVEKLGGKVRYWESIE